MSPLYAGEVVTYCAMVVSIVICLMTGRLYWWTRKLVFQNPKAAQPTVRYTDRPTCAVHGGTIEGDWPPVMVHSQFRFLAGPTIPVTMFICQGCIKTEPVPGDIF